MFCFVCEIEVGVPVCLVLGTRKRIPSDLQFQERWTEAFFTFDRNIGITNASINEFCTQIPHFLIFADFLNLFMYFEEEPMLSSNLANITIYHLLPRNVLVFFFNVVSQTISSPAKRGFSFSGAGWTCGQPDWFWSCNKIITSSIFTKPHWTMHKILFTWKFFHKCHKNVKRQWYGLLQCDSAYSQEPFAFHTCYK